MISLVGYTDKFSARPGETISVKVSSDLQSPYHADLVRIRSADPNPDGPGVIVEAVPAAFAGTYASVKKPIHAGSYGVVATTGLHMDGQWTVCLRVQPWLLNDRDQTVLSIQAGELLSVVIRREGGRLQIGQARCEVSAPLHERQWYELRLIGDQGRIQLMQTPLSAAGLGQPSSTASLELQSPLGAATQVVFAAAPRNQEGAFHQHFNGRVEHPFWLEGAHDSPAPLMPHTYLYPTLLAWWDFSQDIESLRISDQGPFKFHGKMVNLPTRAVRGPFWTGQSMSWKQSPGEYAAVHFHEDDLYDCDWATDFAFAVPHDLRSGVYGIRLRERLNDSSGEEDIIPVFISPGAASPRAKVALVMSTYTYQIYANYDRKNHDDSLKARIAQWGTYPHHPAENKQFGLSCYNLHADGSGVTFSTARRPILTMRPAYIAYTDLRGSGLRHFAADMHIVAWLEAKGIEFDILTDHELEKEGVGALQPYQAVLTGTHPEYQSKATLDAFRDYINGGGRLAYLGGNGFYWRVAVSDTVPDTLEVRRAETGVRSWIAQPGEYYHAFDGSYGGLWRNNGRAPQQLVGIGFSAQGKFEGSYYKRLDVSYEPQFAWMFQGIPDATLGDFGYSGGGAAGFELDRADPLLGTPPQATVLCRSEGHSSTFGATLEELIAPPAYKEGDKAASLVRAEIVYFENDQGGAVFSVGSITFCGSLPWNNFDNSISTLLGNVVGHFLSR
ncbi:N,N-dimethylformamidase beta subunit family domain-containing protein [Bordetella tumulicola]|uniref:N,N-dimethylformamidase beta subunit family domain-containing protein n=1 Tax=Bordetella tumulicola TaxID=1649133 RepID=UPI0039F144FA